MQESTETSEGLKKRVGHRNVPCTSVLRRIRIPQIDHPRQRIRLRHVCRELRLMKRRHTSASFFCPPAAPVLPDAASSELPTIVISRRVRMSAESKGRCSNGMRCSRPRSPNANDVCFLCRCGGGQEDALCRRVVHELFGVNEHFCEVAGGPLGNDLPVAARDGGAAPQRSFSGVFRTSRGSFVVLDGPVVSLRTLRA